MAVASNLRTRLPSQSIFAQLVSLACHDLRTPLATATGFAHTLQRLDSLDARVRLAPRALRWYAFSPDGRELVYNEGYDVYRTAASGGKRAAARASRRSTSAPIACDPDSRVYTVMVARA